MITGSDSKSRSALLKGRVFNFWNFTQQRDKCQIQAQEEKNDKEDIWR